MKLMEALFEFLKESSPAVIAIAAFAYFLKRFLEKKIDALAARNDKRIEGIAEASLDIKTDLRTEERGNIVDLRVAIEEWEYFLQTLLFNYSNTSAAKADINPIFKEEAEKYGQVRINAVKVGAYVRDWEFETQIMDTIQKIRTTTLPLIHEFIPRLIDIHAQLLPIQTRSDAIMVGKMKGISLEQATADQARSAELNEELTNLSREFSDRLISEYQPVVDELVDLKIAINNYVYRPIESTSIDVD